jgi:hypothetical protein
MIHLLFHALLAVNMPPIQPLHPVLGVESTLKSEIKVIKDLNANNTPYVYINLESGKEIGPDQAKSTEWDLAFSKTTIITNGGSSGPGAGSAQVIEKDFDQIMEIPTEGFEVDKENQLGIKSGSGASWYNYDLNSHAIIPIAGRTLLIKTATGRIVKLQIISYYKGAPEEIPTGESSFYTFRYSFADANGKF